MSIMVYIPYMVWLYSLVIGVLSKNVLHLEHHATNAATACVIAAFLVFRQLNRNFYKDRNYIYGRYPGRIAFKGVYISEFNIRCVLY